MGTSLAIGDEGIWVTFARGMKTKAVREFLTLCEEVSVLSDPRNGFSYPAAID
jgi:hypothetical protein